MELRTTGDVANERIAILALEHVAANGEIKRLRELLAKAQGMAEKLQALAAENEKLKAEVEALKALPAGAAPVKTRRKRALLELSEPSGNTAQEA